MLALRDNPVFLRWLTSLRGWKLLPALIPALLGLAVLWFGLATHDSRTGGQRSVLILWVFLAWTYFRSGALGSAGKSADDAGPVDPWTGFIGRAIPLLCELTPFLICHLAWWLIWSVELSAPGLWFTLSAHVFTFCFVGALLIDAAVSSLPGFAGAYRSLRFLVVVVFLLGLNALWDYFLAKPPYWSILLHNGAEWIRIRELILIASLLPLNLAFGPLAALAASRRYLGEDFPTRAGATLKRLLTAFVLVIVAGQCLSFFLFRVVKPALNPPLPRLAPVAELEFSAEDIFLGATADGFLIGRESSVTEYAASLQPLRTTGIDGWEMDPSNTGALLADGSLGLFGHERMLIADWNSNIEILEWQGELGRLEYPCPDAMFGSSLAGGDRVLRIDNNTVDEPDPELSVYDLRDGTKLFSRRLDQIELKRDAYPVCQFPCWTDEFFILTGFGRRLFRLSPGGELLDTFHFPRFRAYLQNSDLALNRLPRFPLGDTWTVAPSGEIVYGEDGVDADIDWREPRLFVFTREGQLPVAYLLDFPCTQIIRSVHAYPDRILLLARQSWDDDSPWFVRAYSSDILADGASSSDAGSHEK